MVAVAAGAAAADPTIPDLGPDGTSLIHGDRVHR